MWVSPSLTTAAIVVPSVEMKLHPDGRQGLLAAASDGGLSARGLCALGLSAPAAAKEQTCDVECSADSSSPSPNFRVDPDFPCQRLG